MQSAPSLFLDSAFALLIPVYASSHPGGYINIQPLKEKNRIRINSFCIGFRGWIYASLIFLSRHHSEVLKK